MRLPVLLIASALMACGGKPEPPKGPLSPEKFERVLMRSLLIEARTGQSIALDQAGPDIHAAYDSMFSEEHVTRADFDSTYRAWLHQPEALKGMYEKVLNDLQQMADTAQAR
ncbi:MAG: DUF4296 domain-containing protein [Flavobacteriales bacterium]|nr:DUF4296 domain-containing protein [Flavobacteriales bacterium]